MFWFALWLNCLTILISSRGHVTMDVNTRTGDKTLATRLWTCVVHIWKKFTNNNNLLMHYCFFNESFCAFDTFDPDFFCHFFHCIYSWDKTFWKNWLVTSLLRFSSLTQNPSSKEEEKILLWIQGLATPHCILHFQWAITLGQ